MAHPQDSTVFETVMQLLTDAGFDGFAQAFQILVNEAMKAERADALQARPYERTDARRGYANGFKPKTVATRLGKIPLRVPQVRGDVAFYPSALERGVRSERALKLAVAEMYVQGISTRKVTEVMETLCGLEISSTDVSRAATLLDDELTQWRTRPLGEMPYLVLDGSNSLAFGGKIVEWRWVFHDGQEVRQARAEKVYDKPGAYVAALWVKDDKGQEDVDFCQVKVFSAANPESAMPHIFMTCTPTEDIRPGQPVRLRFWFQGRGAGPIQVDFDDDTHVAGYQSYAELAHSFKTPGLHVVTAQTTADGMPVEQKLKIVVGK